jgi:hypothetical protein
MKSTDLISLTCDSSELNEGLVIQNKPSYTNSDLNGLSNYVIFKNNTSPENKTETYIPYDETEFLNTNGPSYDSNFIELKKDTNYVLSVNSIIKKDTTTITNDDSGLEFYFTSSISGINQQDGAVYSHTGLLKIGSIISKDHIKHKTFDNPVNMLFSVNCDLYGTLIIVPKKCSAVISQLSIKPYGDYGFSPDTLITKIPFPIKVKNESFEIKSELFDIHSNLVYSELRTVVNFDEDGESLYVYIPGLKDPSNTSVLKGSLKINVGLEVVDNTLLDKNLTVGGTVFMPSILESSYVNERLLSWNKTTGQVYYTNINDIENIGTENVTLKLFTKNLNSNDKSTFRLIPSVEGRNVVVPKKATTLESPQTTQ